MGLFDVSHMGRFRLDGPEQAFLDRVVTRRVAGMAGTDSLLAGHQRSRRNLGRRARLSFADGGGQDCHMLVVNASNREKIIDWLEAYRPGGDVRLWRCTLETAMIAVQGPRATRSCTADVGRPPRRAITPGRADRRTPVVVSRTGYTGEDGWELIVPPTRDRSLATAAGVGSRSGAGRRAGRRDTLRLEAGMPLYGHELTEAIDPFQAGLDFAVHLEGRTFPGREALAKLRERPSAASRRLRLAGRRVPREGYAVLAGERSDWPRDQRHVFADAGNEPIAMGYVSRTWPSREPKWSSTFAAGTSRPRSWIDVAVLSSTTDKEG